MMSAIPHGEDILWHSSARMGTCIDQPTIISPMEGKQDHVK